GAGFELRPRDEELRSAGRAAVDPVVVDVPILATERAFGPFLTQDVVLVWGQGFAPLPLGLDDLFQSCCLLASTLASLQRRAIWGLFPFTLPRGRPPFVSTHRKASFSASIRALARPSRRRGCSS